MHFVCTIAYIHVGDAKEQISKEEHRAKLGSTLRSGHEAATSTIRRSSLGAQTRERTESLSAARDQSSANSS